jgi:hypothetical protein
LNLTGLTNASVDDPIPLAFYHQYGANTSGVVNVSVCLDQDSNPYNGNETVVFQAALPSTGISNVYYSALSLSLNPAVVLPGTYSVFGRISDGVRTRYLYAPQKLVLGPSRHPPTLLSERIQASQFQFTLSGFPGQTVIIQASTDLVQWVSIQTNTLTGTALAFLDPGSLLVPQRYYRAVLAQ